MVNLKKATENINGFSEHILNELDKEAEKLKSSSIKTEFDKKLSKRLKSSE